jgi:hypothetical protein
MAEIRKSPTMQGQYEVSLLYSLKILYLTLGNRREV